MNFFGQMLALLLTIAALAGDEPKPSHSPTLSAKDAAVQAHLKKVIPLDFEKTPLVDVLMTIEEKTSSKTPTDPGIKILVDQNALDAAGVSLKTPVSYKTKEGETLDEALSHLLGTLGLRSSVKQGWITLHGTPSVILDRRKRDQAIRAKLQMPLSFKFREIPLGDALKVIKTATQEPQYDGIPIFMDPIGLQEAGKTMMTPVSIETKPYEPLGSSLGRLLKSLGLAYRVKDGLLTITSETEKDLGLNETKVESKPKPEPAKPD